MLRNQKDERKLGICKLSKEKTKKAGDDKIFLRLIVQ